MNEFAAVLASVNKMSAKVDKADGKAISKNIGKMNQKAAKEEEQLSRILNRMEKNAGFIEMEQEPEAIVNEQTEPAEAMSESVMDEINRYVDEMIRTL